MQCREEPVGREEVSALETFREDQVLERDGQPCLHMQPTIRNDSDVVVRRGRLKHRHRQRDIVLVFGVSLTQHEVVME